MEEITKDGSIVTITTTITETFDIDSMKTELKLLESEPEPTIEQIKESVVLGVIPFYYRPERQLRIDYLKEKIAELEAL